MNTDYIYWTFTAAAQCVSTFVALLLTGYALVLSQIEAARDRDDSLQEIHAALRKTYHLRLTALSWLTALSVAMSLLVVWLNRANEPAPGPMLAMAAALDAIAIVAGLAFVVAIIDPEKYQKAAERALEDQAGEHPHAAQVPSLEYFRAFRRLERALRDRLRRLQGDGAGPPDGEADFAAGLSPRRLADQLLQQDAISDELHAEAIELNRYRNLLFHGEIGHCDSVMVERARQLAVRVRALPPAPRSRDAS